MAEPTTGEIAVADDDEDDVVADDGQEFTLELAPDEPLFAEPLRLKVPGVGTFDLLDYANPPFEDEYNPERQPVSYTVELLSLQVVEDQRDDFKTGLTEALAENRILLRQLTQAAKWIGQKRNKAERAAKGKKAKRPTTARSRSSR